MKTQITEIQKQFILSKLKYTFNNVLNIDKLITKISKDINEIHSLTSNVKNITMLNSGRNKLIQKSPDISKNHQSHPRKQLLSLKSKDNIYSSKNIFEKRIVQKFKEKENKPINDQILNISKTFYGKKLLTVGHSEDKIRPLNKRKTMIKSKDKHIIIDKPQTSRQNKENIDNNKKGKNKELSKTINKSMTDIKIKDKIRRKSVDDINKKLLNKSFISKTTKDKIQRNNVKINKSIDNKNNKNSINNNLKNSTLIIKKNSNIIKEEKTEKLIKKKINYNRSKTPENIMIAKLRIKNKSKNINLNKKNIENKKSLGRVNNLINTKTSKDSEINKEIILKSLNSKTFSSSNYLECLYLSLKSGFFSPNQKLKIFISSKQLYNYLDKEKTIKELINYYSSKNIPLKSENKYDIQKANEVFKPTKLALNSLNFLDKDEQEKLLNEPQNPIVVDFFRIILILLNEYNQNILKENDKIIFGYLFKDLFTKYKVKTIKELMMVIFVDKTPKINDEQFELIQNILEEKPNVFSPATIIKYNRCVSFIAFFIKELYSYLTLKTEDGIYYYQIRTKESRNINEDKINNLRNYLNLLK